MQSAFTAFFHLILVSKAPPKQTKKLQYLLYATFYGGIRVQKGQKCHRKIGLNACEY